LGKYQIYLDRAYDAIDRRAYSDAMKWCKKAIDLDPSAPEAFNARGEALDASGMWEEALQAFDRALERDPQFIEALLNKAEILADRPETCETALTLCDEAEELCVEDDDSYLRAEVFYIRGNALQGGYRLEEALAEYEKALDLLPDHPDYLYEKGVTLYYLLEYERAEECLTSALELDPNNADAHYALGLLFEKTEREERAAEEFAASTRADPTRYPPLLRMGRDRFAELVEKAVAALPEEFTRYMADVAILIEDFPTRDRLSHSAIDPQVLGLFEGRTQAEESGNQLPCRITLFQRNLEKMCETEAELIEQISVTVMHEVGHFFGMSEEQLRELGLE
jgi:predicted Zn-dependent protease with MMP-like domain/lipoprotein NlpI